MISLRGIKTDPVNISRIKKTIAKKTKIENNNMVLLFFNIIFYNKRSHDQSLIPDEISLPDPLKLFGD